MSWREFQLRLLGYKRKEQNDWVKLRELAWTTLIAPGMAQTKKPNYPKSKEAFMPLEGDSDVRQKPLITDEKKQAFLQAYMKWQNERKIKV